MISSIRLFASRPAAPSTDAILTVPSLLPLHGAQVLFVAELCDRVPPHQLHDKIGAARIRRTGVMHFGDVRMVHHGQCLTLGFKAGDHLFGVHPRFNDLQGNLSADGPLLLSNVNDAEAAFADLLQQFVRTDLRAGLFGDGLGDGGGHTNRW